MGCCPADALTRQVSQSVNQCIRHSGPDIDMAPDMVSWADRRPMGAHAVGDCHSPAPRFAMGRGVFHRLAWQQLVHSGSELATLVSGKTKLEARRNVCSWVEENEDTLHMRSVSVCAAAADEEDLKSNIPSKATAEDQA